MTLQCAEHRDYLGAMADSEVDLVPPGTRAHVAVCPRCLGEVEAYRLLDTKIVASVHAMAMGGHGAPGSRPFARTRRRGWRTLAAGLASVAAAVAALVVWSTGHQAPDPVAAALASASQPPAISSTSADAIHQWCVSVNGPTPPVMSLSGFILSGARMDGHADQAILTVYYSTSTGGSVTVSWMGLPGSGVAHPGVTASNYSGKTVLVVQSAAGEAVVTGSASDSQLWAASMTLETAT